MAIRLKPLDRQVIVVTGAISGNGLAIVDLHGPRADALRGSQKVHAGGSSVALQLQKLAASLFTIGLVGAGTVLPTGRRLAKGR